MAIAELFEKLTGRRATPDECARLERIQRAAGLRENDAFLVVLVAMEQYSGLFAEYPAKISAEAARIMSEVRATIGAIAKAEVAACERALARHVADASLELARKRDGRRIRVHEMTLAASYLVAFGSICLTAGYRFGTSSPPFWARPGGPHDGLQYLLAMVVAAPAGWLMFLLALPATVYGARTGWLAARDAGAAWMERSFGWVLVTLSTVGAIAVVALLLKIT